MARPKPKVLLRHTGKNHKTEEVLESDYIYAVFYKNKPINVKLSHSLISYPGPQYKRTSFSSSSPALNMAKKLNEKYKTTDFTVVRFSTGEPIDDGS